jgi:rubrerythrin
MVLPLPGGQPLTAKEKPMTTFMKADEILDFAIQNEQNAVELYTDLAERTKSPAAKVEFLQFANEERGHKVKLEKVKSGRKLLSLDTKVQDLKIADYTVAVELGKDPAYQDILLFAMKQEKAAFRLYSDLAALSPDSEIQELLRGLAQEEAKHKLKFEIEYDDNVLKEN